MAERTIRRTKSGDHPAIKQFRRKADSIAEHTIPMVEALTNTVQADIEQVRSSVPPPRTSGPDVAEVVVPPEPSTERILDDPRPSSRRSTLNIIPREEPAYESDPFPSSPPPPKPKP